MIETKVVRFDTCDEDLCNTYSTEKKKLLQQETGRIFSHTVVDRIAGYDENNKPYCRFTYVETDEIDDEVVEEVESE